MSGIVAKNAATSADNAHPTPVIFVSISEPPLTNSTAPLPSVITSQAPLITTIEPNSRARASAAGSAAVLFAVLSAPRGPAPIKVGGEEHEAAARAMISLPLPRTMVGRCFIALAQCSVRYGVPPQATGSSTHGFLRRVASAIATVTSRTRTALRVPMFTYRASALGRKAGVSSSEQTMAGAAPAASNTLAVMSMETGVCRHCTREFLRRSSPSSSEGCRRRT
mmetsp:Transcript_34441/g.50420  ORF Transcript_34441/g.50420 Transcript_34441/m.50420 type:complete len:223 (+) Transcript_34441:814-1482(+)